MAMSSSAKKKLGFLGLALAALAIDRGLIFSGGSDASAQASVADTAATQTGAAGNSTTAEPVVPIAQTLNELRDSVAAVPADDRDAFRLPEVLAPRVEDPIVEDLSSEIAQEPVAPQARPLPNFEVSSIIANSTGTKMAVINGTPIRLGETKQGITLISVSARTATIGYDGRTVELRLSH